jgi:hypothetical protein
VEPDVEDRVRLTIAEIRIDREMWQGLLAQPGDRTQAIGARRHNTTVSPSTLV